MGGFETLATGRNTRRKGKTLENKLVVSERKKEEVYGKGKRGSNRIPGRWKGGRSTTPLRMRK